MRPPRSPKRSSFLIQAAEAARRGGYVMGAVQGAPPLVGTGRPEEVKDAKIDFLNEVAALLAGRETVAMMKQFPAQGVVDVFIASAGLRNDCNSVLLARHDLSNRNPIQLIQELHSLVSKYNDKFERLLDIRACISEDTKNTYNDPEVGDALLSLREILWGCASEVDENTLESARFAAGRVIQYRQAGQRLKKLVPNVFRNQDVLRVYWLSEPELLNNAFVHPGNGGRPPCIRIYGGLPSYTSKNWSTPASNNRPLPPSPNNRVTPPSNNRSVPPSYNRSTLPSNNRSPAPSPNNPVTPPSRRPTLSPPKKTGELIPSKPCKPSPSVDDRPFQSVALRARLYLDPEDQSTGVMRLMPVEKRQAFILLTSVLQNRNPAIEDDAYLVFGYAACKDDAEIIHLRSLYRALLVECVDKREMFKAFWMALKANRMVSFLKQNEYSGPVLDRIPMVVDFFKAPTDRRPSVFRHIQFLRAEHVTEPPAVLRRDYGYHLCKQREEVEKLKRIYKHVIQHRGPKALHKACCSAQLHKLVMDTKAPINPKRDSRFFTNISPHPDLGFEPGNLDGYQLPLFKKQK